MSLATLTWRQPRLVALALLVIIASGASALISLGRQEDPTITNIFATITTPYPGADPARVEALVTTEIERALREVPEVDVIESTSSGGISIVSIELAETTPPDDIEAVWSDVRDAVDDAARGFPAGVRPPEVETDGAGAYGAIVALTPARGEIPATLAARWAETLADRLRSVPGTNLVEVFGGGEEEVAVTLDTRKTAALGLTPAEVAAAIRGADAKVSAGGLVGQSADLVIEVAGEIEALDRLRDVVLREGPGGTTVRLGDVARIGRGTRAPSPERALHDGKPAVLVAARLEDGLQVDRWARDLRAELDAFRHDMPRGLAADLTFDQSTYTADRLAEVGLNMAIGVGLVILVLLVTLGLRAALIVGAILPVVSLASLATMNAIGLPIHQMSVTGLIVALGLLVDAGIVMTDEIGQRLRAGVARSGAVAAAVRRLTLPLFASTATTALSFTPMILLPGPAGDFVGAIAIAVVIMLTWSFIVAVTITPAMAGWLLNDRAGGLSAGIVGRLFAASLRLAYRNPIRAMALALVLPLLGFASMPLLTAQFFPGVDRDQFHIEVDLAPGASIDRTAEVVRRLDAELRRDDRIDSVSWVIGRSAPAFYYNIVGDRDGAPRYAQALVRTVSAEATEAALPDLERRLPAIAPEAQVLVRGLVQGPPVSAPVELRLVGPDLDVLRAEGEALRRIVTADPNVTLARTSITEGAPKLEVRLDEARARLVGLDPGAVAAQLDAALTGITGGTMVEGTEELPVRVRFDDLRRSDAGILRDMSIVPPRRPEGDAYAAIPLSALADLVLLPGEGQITRRNGERANTVQAFLRHGVLPEEALSEVQARIAGAGYELPAGYRLEIGGDSDARNSTLNNLVAPLGLIVTFSIAVVVLTFQSFRLAAVALVVSGLSAGLSLLSLAVFDYPFGINAVIGLIGSIGVAVNAALIILSALQEDADAASGDAAAMASVVMASSRHIVSTTVTTVGGFLPLILAGGGFWPPFAMAIAGGVLLSTVVSFYFVPPAFRLVWARPSRRVHSGATELQSSPGPIALAAE